MSLQALTGQAVGFRRQKELVDVVPDDLVFAQSKLE